MLSMHDSEDLDGLAKMADRIHENDSRVSRTAASSAGHFSHVTKTPTTSLLLDSVSDKLNDLSVCVEQCWTPQVFFLSPQSANPQPNFNFLNPQPQVRNWTFKSLVRNRKSATTFRDS